MNRENVEPCSTIDESLSDDHVADDGRVEYGECAGSGRALELICGAEGDGSFGPPERGSCFRLGEHRVHLARELLEDVVRSRGM